MFRENKLLNCHDQSNRAKKSNKIFHQSPLLLELSVKHPTDRIPMTVMAESIPRAGMSDGDLIDRQANKAFLKTALSKKFVSKYSGDLPTQKVIEDEVQKFISNYTVTKDNIHKLELKIS